MSDSISWTPELLAKLKDAVKESARSGSDNFTFDGHEFYVPYAKYLIEYLEDHFRTLNMFPTSKKKGV